MKSLLLVLIIAIGVAGIVYGERDDSPGLQLLCVALLVGKGVRTRMHVLLDRSFCSHSGIRSWRGSASLEVAGSRSRRTKSALFLDRVRHIFVYSGQIADTEDRTRFLHDMRRVIIESALREEAAPNEDSKSLLSLLRRGG